MGDYRFTLYALPSLATSVLVTVLAVYSWRRRMLPGATAFSCMMWMALFWIACEVLLQAGVSPEAKIFWYKVQVVWLLPMATGALCFALTYADLGRRLNAYTFAALSVPPVLVALVVATNDAHHLFWQEITVSNGSLQTVPNIAAWGFASYGFILTASNLVIFGRLFYRSPPHRLSVVLFLCAYAAIRVGVALDMSGQNPLAPMTATPLAGAIYCVLYAVALFRFRMLDLVTVARRTVIEQLGDGLLVLDLNGRVVEINAAARTVLQVRETPTIIGVPLSRGLASDSPLFAWLDEGSAGPLELQASTGETPSLYTVNRTKLADPRGLPLGEVLVFHDVTEERRIQEYSLAQKQALAVLEERDRIGRELHDSLGQVMGYLKMQLYIAGELLAKGRLDESRRVIGEAGAAAQEAHTDIREYIADARSAILEEGFLASLAALVRQFGERGRFSTNLRVEPAFGDGVLDPMAEVQLLRIIHEALTNVRKHAGASNVEVRLGVEDGHARAAVRDDGAGFDISSQSEGVGRSFGLGFMRERSETVGGSLIIDSVPGRGTSVLVSIPFRKDG